MDTTLNRHQTARWIAEPRFAPYLVAAADDHAQAIALYVWNARMSAAMFETLHHIEVLLRNAIDTCFAPVDPAAAPERTWLTDAQILRPRTREQVEQTIQRIRRDHHRPTRARVVAGLSFGFWRALFNRRYTQLWVSHLHHAFPAGSGERAEVAGLLSRLLPFRNRLAHHEMIIGRPTTQRYADMLELAALIDPAARDWIELISRVPVVLAEQPPAVVPATTS